MPEPTSSALAVTAAGASSLAVMATALGVPAPVVLAAILGATIAVSASGKLDLSLRSIFAALLAFTAALGVGIWGGHLAGHVVVGLLNSIPGVPTPLPEGVADPLCTVILAMLAQRELLPLGLSLVRSQLEGAAGKKGDAE